MDRGPRRVRALFLCLAFLGLMSCQLRPADDEFLDFDEVCEYNVSTRPDAETELATSSPLFFAVEDALVLYRAGELPRLGGYFGPGGRAYRFYDYCSFDRVHEIFSPDVFIVSAGR